jgi:hypothetical protein
MSRWARGARRGPRRSARAEADAAAACSLWPFPGRRRRLEPPSLAAPELSPSLRCDGGSLPPRGEDPNITRIQSLRNRIRCPRCLIHRQVRRLDPTIAALELGVGRHRARAMGRWRGRRQSLPVHRVPPVPELLLRRRCCVSVPMVWLRPAPYTPFLTVISLEQFCPNVWHPGRVLVRDSVPAATMCSWGSCSWCSSSCSRTSTAPRGTCTTCTPPFS